MKFAKYHGLGNDYLIIDPDDQPVDLSPDAIRRICHRNFGVGADGILVGPTLTDTADFALRIFNPDGGEAEKSGNGLRIFARYLYDKHLAGHRLFHVATAGGVVGCRVLEDGLISVDMGRVSFDTEKIPITGPKRLALKEKLVIDGEEIIYCGATIGNPHCVVLRDDISPELAKRLGPKLEIHPDFPNRTNVQFLKILERRNIAIEIWERGAGYTLASGSSSSAAAAMAFKLGLVDADITVHMPGGDLDIAIHPDMAIALTGPVVRVCGGMIDPELFQQRLP